MKKLLPYFSAIFLTAFGILTLFMSSSVIFDLFGIRAKEGNYVLFIVWTNFLCGIIYLCAAFGFFKSKKWTALLLGSSIVILIAAFISLLLHINTGGIYETKTVGAMIFRIGVTGILTVIA